MKQSGKRNEGKQGIETRIKSENRTSRLHRLPYTSLATEPIWKEKKEKKRKNETLGRANVFSNFESRPRREQNMTEYDVVTLHGESPSRAPISDLSATLLPPPLLLFSSFQEAIGG